MRKIVAIGGGSISQKRYQAVIDREIIRLSGKKSPRVVFLPTASEDSPRYSELFQRLYEKRLGCHVDVLRLYPTFPSQTEIQGCIDAADIVYVGGGNTLKMIARWKRAGVDRALRRAYLRGAVMCGTSAGAIAWFAYGNSDSRKFRNPKAGYIRVSALGYLPALLCPHYNSEPARKPALKKMMRRTRGIALALEEETALEIVGDRYRVLRRDKTSHIYRCAWSKGRYREEVLPIDEELRPLHSLLRTE